jgi:hypothetical protein
MLKIVGGAGVAQILVARADARPDAEGGRPYGRQRLRYYPQAARQDGALDTPGGQEFPDPEPLELEAL